MAPEAAGAEPLPAVFGKYRIERKLGRGGMGEVLLARQLDLDRLVVLKVVAPELARDANVQERLRREARAAAQINSDFVVRVHDVGKEGDRPFIAMEYVEGVSAAALLEKRGRLEPAEATRIVLAVAKGLKAAHEVDVLHRDVKPANILISRDGHVKLADFGLAKLHSGARTGSKDPESTAELQPLSIVGGVLGTPEYMSPEQADGAALDARADLYSLGVTYYELITGKRPFRGPLASLLVQVLTGKLTPPREIVPTIPVAVERACLSLMARDKENRPASAAATIELLASTLRGLGAVTSASAVPLEPAAASPVPASPAPVSRTQARTVAAPGSRGPAPGSSAPARGTSARLDAPTVAATPAGAPTGSELGAKEARVAATPAAAPAEPAPAENEASARAWLPGAAVVGVLGLALTGGAWVLHSGPRPAVAPSSESSASPAASPSPAAPVATPAPSPVPTPAPSPVPTPAPSPSPRPSPAPSPSPKPRASGPAFSSVLGSAGAYQDESGRWHVPVNAADRKILRWLGEPCGRKTHRKDVLGEGAPWVEVYTSKSDELYKHARVFGDRSKHDDHDTADEKWLFHSKGKVTRSLVHPIELELKLDGDEWVQRH